MTSISELCDIVLYYFTFYIILFSYFILFSYLVSIILHVLVHVTFNFIVGSTKQSYYKYQKRLSMSLISLAGIILGKPREEFFLQKPRC